VFEVVDVVFLTYVVFIDHRPLEDLLLIEDKTLISGLCMPRLSIRFRFLSSVDLFQPICSALHCLTVIIVPQCIMM